MKHLSLLIAVFALVLAQCERHSWEDVEDADGNLTEKGTKRLFEEHGDGHGDKDHAGKGDHAKTGEGHDKDAKKTGGAEHDHDGDGEADH